MKRCDQLETMRRLRVVIEGIDFAMADLREGEDVGGMAQAKIAHEKLGRIISDARAAELSGE